MRETVSSCPAIWKELAASCPDNTALIDEHLCDEKIDLTFADMEDKVRRSAAAFKNLGVTKGVNVAVLGENSAVSRKDIISLYVVTLCSTFIKYKNLYKHCSSQI